MQCNAIIWEFRALTFAYVGGRVAHPESQNEEEKE